MTELSNEILNVLNKYNIKPEEISIQLQIINEELINDLWQKIYISEDILYNFKDTVFYNFEHIALGGPAVGKTNLKYLGINYPKLMYCFNDTPYILKEDIDSLLQELKDIKSKWNTDIFIANLYSKSNLGWNGGDNPSEVIIFEKNKDSLAQYGYKYNSTYSSLYDSTGNKLKLDNDIILCSIRKINEYNTYNIFTNLLNNLYNTCLKAQKSNKGIYIDINNYNYNE